MKTISTNLGRIITVLLLGIFILVSCSKIGNENALNISTSESETIQEDLSYEEYQLLLFDLYAEFWTNISSNSLAEIKNVCDEKDVEGLIRLSNLSEKELSNFIRKAINYSSHINVNKNVSDCNCVSDNNFENIYSFVEEIQKSGGGETFFQVYSQDALQNLGTRGEPDWNRIAQCLAVCSMTCLPLGWNPPAYAACMAACSAACYFIQD